MFLDNSLEDKQELLRLVSKWAVHENDVNDEEYIHDICYGILIDY